MNRRPNPSSGRRGFLLFETMLGVALFALGVISLGYAVNNCLEAQAAMADSNRARLALENRMSMVYGGAIPAGDKLREELEGAFTGITLTQTSEPLEAKDEDGNDILGITVVTLVAEWTAAGEKQRRDLSFYVSTTF